jgi:HlyD family secretion protein
MLKNNKYYGKIQEIVKKRPGVSIAGGVVLVIVLWGILSLFSGGDANSSIPTYTVKEGPLKISVTQSGTIQPAEKIIVKNQVAGSSTIVWIIDEGSKVKKGDLMVELDSSTLSDNKTDQEINVSSAEANLISARENFEVTKNQAQSDIDAAKLAYELAGLDLEKYKNGSYPNDLKSAQSDITTAEEELSTAKDKLEWDKKLLSEKYLSQTEYNTDSLSHTQKELAVQLKTASKDLLEKYSHKRDLAEKESAVKQDKAALERTTRKAKASIVEAEATLKAKDGEYERQKAKLTKIENQLAATKVYAPADGTIIYATSAEQSRSRFGGQTEPLKVGNSVRERQELIHLPTTAGYSVSISIPESSIDKVKVGLPAQVTVDTLPNVVFTGKVTSVASVVNAQNAFLNPDLKVYDTVITLDKDNNSDFLRSGMTCTAEIVVEQYDKAVYVPVQAVMSVSGKQTVYIAKGSKVKPRVVETGLDNNIVIMIKNGLKAGEVISLSPPLAQATAVDQSFEKVSNITKTTKASDASSGTKNGNQNADSNNNNPSAQGGNNQGGDSSQSGAQQGGRGNMPSGGQQGGMPDASNMIKMMDKDSDGKISKSEWQGPEEAFKSMDKNSDGYITKEEFSQGMKSMQGNKQGNDNSKKSGSRYSTTGTDTGSSEGGMQGGGPGGGEGGGGGGGSGPGGM